MTVKKKTLYIPPTLDEKAKKRQAETFCSSFNDYVMQLIKLDTQKKILK